MYMYGGLFVGNVSSDTGIWTYSPNEETWQLQQESIIPTRLVNGGMCITRQIDTRSRSRPKLIILSSGNQCA